MAGQGHHFWDVSDAVIILNYHATERKTTRLNHGDIM